MTKSNLIDIVAESASIKKKEAELAVNAVFSSIETALKEGDKLQLIGFGTFKVKERGERKGCNPRTREEIVIPASKTPVFIPGQALKDAVNG